MISTTLKIEAHKDPKEFQAAPELPLLVKFHGHPTTYEGDTKKFEVRHVNKTSASIQVDTPNIYHKEATESCPVHTMELTIKKSS